MAIFYEKIKGCSTDTTGNSNKDLWSILKWGEVPEGLNTTAIENFRIDFIPSLEVHGSSNEDKSKYNFGHFLVAGPTPKQPYSPGSNYIGQYIYTDLCFGNQESKLYVEKIQGLDTKSNNTVSINNFVNITQSKFAITADDNNNATFVMNNKDDDDAVYEISLASDNTTLTSHISKLNFHDIQLCSFSPAPTGADASPFQFQGAVKVTGEIQSTSKIEGLYFNATSDSRAKTILGKAPDALNTVVDTPIYEYFYKDDAKKTELIGILAQDLLKKHDVFHIVDNQSATGVDGDYMTIKEDRLVFILWKAVQELEAEVKTLRQEVRELRGGE